MNARAYYNEIDPFAAQWLRNLIEAGHIAPGDVDERSIVDVRPGDLAAYTQCHFFAGIGGWSYALRLAGWPDEQPVWTGSCPCQPFSLAGKQKGFDDERHLWPVWRELIRECDPSVVFGEQVASASDWLRLVRSDLEFMGRAVGAIPFEAASAGADHLRNRYGFVAHANHAGSQGHGRPFGVDDSARWQGSSRHLAETGVRSLAHASGERGCRRAADSARTPRWDGPEINGPSFDWITGPDGKIRRVKSGIRLLAHGVPNRVGLLRGFGNAIDPRAFSQFILAAQEAIGDVTP